MQGLDTRSSAIPADSVFMEQAMSVKETMEHKLKTTFSPEEISVVDESHLHKGHGGWREGGETHFRVEMVSKRFSGVSRIDRHRMVNEALKQELEEGVHALAIRASAPEERS